MQGCEWNECSSISLSVRPSDTNSYPPSSLRTLLLLLHLSVPPCLQPPFSVARNAAALIVIIRHSHPPSSSRTSLLPLLRPSSCVILPFCSKPCLQRVLSCIYCCLKDRIDISVCRIVVVSKLRRRTIAQAKTSVVA